ncbi:Mediator complex protein [Geosmithia morbida]|uniref:Mediator of RNA polymerase II transcription subunit 11 n=1 Tax=Geosmithia morbida TaxID=1094350 RepID=A0A9P4YTN3_9HYPO|nr:Mediator complex protein [Geosmithia morbida]KAF4121855.1 Mediator complex protein [Geosmithia morbida]
MSSPDDKPMGDVDDNTHQPFTVEENIRQLSEIDRSTVQLMSHTATALDAVSMGSLAGGGGGDGGSAASAAAQKEALHSATDSFLHTLHSVDVRMKRQIMALEEAGIVKLGGTSRQEPHAAAAGTGTGTGTGTISGKTSLRPDGMGNVGGLDIGWLNSQGSKVEREMEAELWDKARAFLERQEDKKTG